jgi:hypothetical protein
MNPKGIKGKKSTSLFTPEIHGIAFVMKLLIQNKKECILPNSTNRQVITGLNRTS